MLFRGTEFQFAYLAIDQKFMATIICENFWTYRKKTAFVFYDFLKQQLFYDFFLTIAVNSKSYPSVEASGSG